MSPDIHRFIVEIQQRLNKQVLNYRKEIKKEWNLKVTAKKSEYDIH